MPDLTPAEEIRSASALLRKRADPVAPPPWRAEGRHVTATRGLDGDGALDWDQGFTVAACMRQDEAEWVAAMSPAFGLALADWLDERARDAEGAYRVRGGWSFGGCDDPAGIEAALKIAREYLKGGGS